MKKHKIVITVGVEKSDVFRFARDGFMKCECPFCEHLIELKINSLPNDTSITPTVDIHFEEWEVLR